MLFLYFLSVNVSVCLNAYATGQKVKTLWAGKVRSGRKIRLEGGGRGFESVKEKREGQINSDVFFLHSQGILISMYEHGELACKARKQQIEAPDK